MHARGDDDVVIVVQKYPDHGFEFFDEIAKPLELIDKQDGRLGTLYGRRIVDERAHLVGEVIGRHVCEPGFGRSRAHAIYDGIEEMRLAAALVAEEDDWHGTDGFEVRHVAAKLKGVVVRLVYQK
ncbi:MAG: hypothetical protein AMXMBFR82_50800 [Candidatus Hydrogenedentota bacterium]